LLKNYFLIAGLSLLVVNRYILPFSDQAQTILFLAGLICVGIPHGGADQLIAIKTSNHFNLTFTAKRFALIYCAQISLFLLFFYFLPFPAILIFLLMAAYHFGETDLHIFECHSYPDKFLRLLYGLLILGIILLPNIVTVQMGLLNLNPAGTSAFFMEWLVHYNKEVLLFLFTFFWFTTLLAYIYRHDDTRYDWRNSVQLVILMMVLYRLPLLLSFTFYFIAWHSVSSLINMVNYLIEDRFYDSRTVIKEIIKNSFIVLIGICVVGYICSFYFESDHIILSAIIGLAALTGPHMHIMNGMYAHMNAKPQPE